MLQIFTVYDSKVGAFMTPIFLRSCGEASRVFESTVQTPDHDFSKYPEDYTLFHIGSFDPITCAFDILLTPVSLGVAVQYVRPDRSIPSGVVS